MLIKSTPAGASRSKKIPWFGSHSCLISSDFFVEDAWRATQSNWEEAYWDTRSCLKYRREHREIYKHPYNLSSISRVVALYIILLAIMFASMLICIATGHSLGPRFYGFIVPYIFIAAAATWVIFIAYRHKVDFYWRLFSRRLFIYEQTWPGIKALADTDSQNGVKETPPPLERREPNR